MRPPPPDYAGALSPPPAGPPPPDLDQLPDAGSFSALRAEPVAVGLGVEEPGETNPSGPCGVAETVAAVRAGLRRVRAQPDFAWCAGRDWPWTVSVSVATVRNSG